MTERGFDEATLDLLRNQREVLVETRRGDAVHRTIIWVVVDGAGRVLIRSVRGASARWYGEAVGAGSGALVAGATSVPVRFERATTPSASRPSAAHSWRSTGAAVRPSRCSGT